MLHVLSNSAVFCLLIAIGYLLKEKNILRAEHRGLFRFLLMNLTIPCAVLSSFNPDIQLSSLLGAMAVTAVGCLGLDLLALLLWRKKQPAERAGAVLLSNGYLGASFALPFVQANLPPTATPMYAAFEMVQCMFNIGVNYGIGKSLTREQGAPRGNPLKAFLTILCSPVILASLLVFLLTALQRPLPAFFQNLTEKIGGANIFLSMLFAGMVLDLRLDMATLKKLLGVLSLRYLGALVIGLCCFLLLPLGEQMSQVLLLGFLAPVSSAALVYSDTLGCDMQVAGAAASLSLIISVMLYTGLLLLWV